MTDSEKPWYLPVLEQFLLEDVPRLLGIPADRLSRDVDTLRRRCIQEGESFITKTLPSLGKAIDLALRLEGATPITRSFSKRTTADSRPRFLWALMCRVFDAKGALLASPCTRTIALLRQICFWCKKVKKGFTDESLLASTFDFIEVDRSLPSDVRTMPGDLLAVSRALVESVLGDCPRLDSIRPKHGPGATSDCSDPVGKRFNRRSFKSLESVFRPIPWFFSLREAAADPQVITERIRCDFGLSKLAFVEKDSSGPRLIGLEPSEYMWCQQALKAWMYTHIEENRFTRGHVNFTNQDVNRSLTKEWELFDTLDMSKASDRNSLVLVEALFGCTKLWPYLQACRTPGVVLPNGDVLMYKKFAPMGSAVCFPVQALVYWALACASLHLRQGMPLLAAMTRVFVYGDDLVVPHGCFASLRVDFESCSLKFNSDKCCVSGKFRESCGADTYDRCDVTPVRLRRPHVQTDLDVVSLVGHANGLYVRGYRAASLQLRKCMLHRFPRLREMHIPCATVDLPILAWSDDHDTYRIHYENWIPYVKGWTLRPITVESNMQCEEPYYRESLARGGPVGRFKRLNVRTSRDCKIPKIRVFDTRYSGNLSFRKVPFWPTPMCVEQTSWLA